MAPTHIKLSDDTLLAEYVELDRFKGILEQRVAIGPDMLAMLIKDGEIAEASAGAHFAIGGMWRTLKDTIGGKHAIRLLIADLKPFQLSTSASSLTKDNVPVACEFTVDLQVNPEKPANVLGLAKEHLKVTKSSMLERLKPHLGERVLNAAVRRVDALELRGNNAMQDMVQAETMKEVERVADDLGLMARSVTVAWGFNDEEKAAILKRNQEREQETLEREFAVLNRSAQRGAESTVIQLQADLAVEQAKVATEDDLRRLILANELSFVAARETGIRMEQVKALEQDLLLNRTQRLDGLKAQLEVEQHAVAMARAAGDKRNVERDVDLGEHNHELAVSRIKAEIAAVKRTIEDSDRRQKVALDRIEWEFAQDVQEGRIKLMGGIGQVEQADARAALDNSIRKGEAEQRWRNEAAQLAAAAEAERIRLLTQSTPEHILAINAASSTMSANVLVEQAKAKAQAGADKEAVYRDMARQSQEFFESGMRSVTAVAQGMSGGVAVSKPAAAAAAGDTGTIECPDCHHQIAAVDRFCPYCTRQMRH